LNRVVGVFTLLEVQLRAELRCDVQRESLVGALCAELRPLRLETLDLTWAVGGPRRRHVVR
jgi:hypothetical protein